MRKFWMTIAGLLLCSLSAAENETLLVHFGDSNTITDYLPAEKRVDALLQSLLRAHYKTTAIRCINAGEGGDYIRQFLDQGRYEKIKKAHPKIDIACIRYGQNDMKKYSPEEFKKHLEEFIGALKKDYPGIHILLETGIFIDGRHWADQTQDATRYCNDKYEKYWAVTRLVAQEQNLPLIDQFRRWQVETAAGRWDLRIRNGEHAADPEHPAHFYNAHANEAGVKLYAEELLRHLKFYFKERLPKAGDTAADPSKQKIPAPEAMAQPDK